MNLRIAVSIDDVCNDLVFELRASTDIICHCVGRGKTGVCLVLLSDICVPLTAGMALQSGFYKKCCISTVKLAFQYKCLQHLT